MNETADQSGTVQSDRTLFTIIDALRQGRAGVTELADRTGLSKSTVHKHLKTLNQLQYVVNDGQEYRLGFKFLTLGGRVRDENELCHLANVKAGELRDETGQMVLVSVEEHGYGIFTYVDRSSYDIKNIILGERFYLHATASGKAMLAGCTDERIHHIVDEVGLPRLTGTTVTSKEPLFEEVEEIRDRGVAFNWEERQQGIRAVSAAVRHPETDTVCAMTVAGPANRLPEEDLRNEYANAVLGMANELELEMKY